MDTRHDLDSAFEQGSITTMRELQGYLRRFRGLHVRYSEGPTADMRARSVDTESGLELPGLSVNPLDPEDWWHRPVSDWLARQLSQYRHLQDQNPDRFAWVLTGQIVGRGPDCEPLLSRIVPIAALSDELLDEAEDLYRAYFEAGKGPED